jgi:hypothetical protein
MKRNWKTTLAGVIAALCLSAKPATPEKYHKMLDTSAQGAAAIGLVFAADSARKNEGEPK